MVEQVLIDLRSCYPQSFDFEQMDTVLKLVRDRMQADSMSRHETIKESFFCDNTVTLKGLDLTQHHEYDPHVYTVFQDNDGFGSWLAYQVGL